MVATNSDANNSSSNPPIPSNLQSLRANIETILVKFEQNAGEAFGYFGGYVDKEPEPYDVQECAADILALLTQHAISERLDELEKLRDSEWQKETTWQRLERRIKQLEERYS